MVTLGRVENVRCIGGAGGDSTLASPRHFLDVGSGSGALCIALLHQWPDAHAVAIDVAPEAAALTLENARLHGLTGRLTVLCTCISEPAALLAAAPAAGFDLIVANPPYISTVEWQLLAPEVKQWESRQARSYRARFLAAICARLALDESRSQLSARAGAEFWPVYAGTRRRRRRLGGGAPSTLRLPHAGYRCPWAVATG